MPPTSASSSLPSSWLLLTHHILLETDTQHIPDIVSPGLKISDAARPVLAPLMFNLPKCFRCRALNFSSTRYTFHHTEGHFCPLSSVFQPVRLSCNRIAILSIDETLQFCVIHEQLISLHLCGGLISDCQSDPCLNATPFTLTLRVQPVHVQLWTHLILVPPKPRPQQHSYPLPHFSKPGISTEIAQWQISAAIIPVLTKSKIKTRPGC